MMMMMMTATVTVRARRRRRGGRDVARRRGGGARASRRGGGHERVALRDAPRERELHELVAAAEALALERPQRVVDGGFAPLLHLRGLKRRVAGVHPRLRRDRRAELLQERAAVRLAAAAAAAVGGGHRDRLRSPPPRGGARTTCARGGARLSTRTRDERDCLPGADELLVSLLLERRFLDGPDE